MADRRFRLLAWILGVTAIGVLVFAVATDLQAHARDRSMHSDLSAARAELRTLRTDVAVTTYTDDVTTSRRDAIRGSVATTMAQVGTTDTQLSGTDAFAFLQGVGIGTFETCLGGVRGAFGQIAAHNDTLAADEISAVSGACTTLAGGSTDGLVYPFDFPDPFVLTVGNRYFAYATNSVGGNIQIITSTDLHHWSAVGDALPTLPSWAVPDLTWAPAVLQVGSTYVLYYSVRTNDQSGSQECVSVATATQPQGPFTDTSSAPLECQPTLGGSIDPSPFVDANGTMYLVWKSNGGGGTSALWSEQLDPTGTTFAVDTAPTQLLVPDQSWEGGVIEAPDLVMSGGRYFLFFSGNSWKTSDYAVGVATCTGPLGPCTEPLSGPILSSGASLKGPGGESVVTDASGATWIAFHAWLPGAVGYPNSRSLYLRRIDLTGPTPVVAPVG